MERKMSSLSALAGLRSFIALINLKWSVSHRPGQLADGRHKGRLKVGFKVVRRQAPHRRPIKSVSLAQGQTDR